MFTTAHDAERLVVRPKDLVDGAVPSANSVAADALLRLAALTGRERYRSAGERILSLSAPLLAEHPGAVADLVAASALVASGSEVVIVGDRPDLVETARTRWLPTAVVAWGEPTGSPLWEDREEPLAYVCRGFTCRTPTGDAGTLASQLTELEREGFPG